LTSASKQADPSFEKELANMESVVNLLERGETVIEEAIREYERGYQSLKRCQEILERAQKKIELLTSFPPLSAASPSIPQGKGAGETPPSWRPFDLPSAQHPADEVPATPSRAGAGQEKPEAINSKE